MKEITASSFAQEVLTAQGKVVVDFWASWCMPCKMLTPVLEEVSKELPEVSFCKVNVDEEQELAAKYGVASIPTVLVFEGGEVVNQSVGFRPKAEMLAFVQGK